MSALMHKKEKCYVILILSIRLKKFYGNNLENYRYT